MSVFNLAKPDRPIEVGVILMNGFAFLVFTNRVRH